VFGAILGLSILLSYWSIGTGVPHTASTDEPDIVGRSLKMMRTGDLNPHFFDYGGFTIYLHTLVGSARFGAGAMSGRWTSLDQIWEGDLYLWCRAATAFFNVMTVYVMYRIGRRWSESVAVAAALLTAVHPYLTRQAHFALTDTPLMFFVAETTLLALVASERGALRWFLLAGLTTGLAAATKYNGAMALILPLAVAITAPTVQARWPAILAAGTGAALGLLAAAPYTLLDLPRFLNAFGSLASHFTNVVPPMEIARTYVKYMRIGLGFSNHGVGLWFGWPGLLLIVIGAALLVGQLFSPARRTAALVALLFPTMYFYMLSHQSLMFARYLLPMIPATCLAMAIAISEIAGRLGRRPVAIVLLLLTVVPPATQAANWDRGEQNVKTEELAASWIQQNLPPGQLIVIDDPRIRLPPSHPAAYAPRLALRTADEYKKDGVAYLVTSSQQTDAYFADPATYAAQVAAWNRLYAASEFVKIFRPAATTPGSTITILKIR